MIAVKRIIIRVLSAITAVAVLFGFCTVASAEQTSDIEPTRLQSSDTYYSYNSLTKTLTISGEGDMPDFTNTSGGDTSQPWFFWRSDGSIEHVVVEEGVTGIGNYAFYNISTADLSLPDSVSSFGSYSFSGMSGIAEFTVPENVTSLPNNLFYQCYGLQTLTVHRNVRTIGASAFEECTALNSVTFESDYMTVSVGKSAFLKCGSLTDVKVPLNASLSSYSFGFTKARSGYTDSNTRLLVYSDSAAYSYALKNAINYSLINTVELSAGDTVTRSYGSNNISEVMCFTFNCVVTDKYTFLSQGSTDVDCKLYNSSNELICESSDNSIFDLNFTIVRTLSAGEEYTFRVSSINSEGEYSVSLLTTHELSVTQTVAPTVRNDGYTVYTCSLCGESFCSDYVSRLGRAVTGRIVELMSPDGSTVDGDFLAGITVYNEELQPVCQTDENGCFTYDFAYGFIVIGAPYGAPRAVTISADSSDLGDIAIVNCDRKCDGYINAKDFAIVKRQDGEWKYSPSFYSIGKIDESIYSNLG